MIGIIGGSGLYAMEGFEETGRKVIDTPFGEPSDAYVFGKISGFEAVFLPRHGKGHRLLPSEINYRANIYGFKKLGVNQIVSLSAVGSFREELKPKDVCLPDQFIDRTTGKRQNTFFGEGLVGHVSFGEPICPRMLKIIDQSSDALNVTVHAKGTYVNIEGPAFSTKAESILYKSWGADIIGMTNIVEARLAREAEMCYATVALITDYDSWHPGHDSVTAAMIIENFTFNIKTAQKIIKAVVPALAEASLAGGCSCRDHLAGALITDPAVIPGKRLKELDIIIGKYMDKKNG